MKKVKKLIVAITAVGVLGAAGAVYAWETKNPAEITAGITGKSVEDVYNERQTGKTYGTIAKESGKLDEFKQSMLEQKKVVLDQRVKDGNLKQQQADEIYNTIKNNQVSCDGTGNAKIGKKFGAGFGRGQGMGKGMGYGGFGSGMGYGRGMNR